MRTEIITNQYTAPQMEAQSVLGGLVKAIYRVLDAVPSMMVPAFVIYAALIVFGTRHTQCAMLQSAEFSGQPTVQKISYQCGLANPLGADRAHIDRIARPCTASIDGGPALPARVSSGMISIMNDVSTQINLRTGEFVANRSVKNNQQGELTGRCMVS